MGESSEQDVADPGRDDGGLKWTSPAVVLGGLVLAGFAGLVIFMTSQAAAPSESWTRLAYVYTSVEAIVFAAAGAVFGTRVQRAQTEEARSRAERAQRRAENNEAQAAGGRALAKAIKGAKRTEGSQVDESFGPPGMGGPAPDGGLEQLAAMASELFPEA
jgi:hypothetical protein